MATQTDIYLTDGVRNFAKENPTNSIDSSVALSATEFTALIFAAAVIAFIYFIFVYLEKASEGASLGDTKKNMRIRLGALIALALVYAVLSSVGGLTFNLGLKPLTSSPSPANTQPSSALASPIVAKENDGTGGTPILSTDEASMWQTVQANEAEVRASLAAKGISINSAPCPSTNSSNCTSVGGLGTKTVDLLGSLRAGCSCTVTVTGGTEWWLHSKTTKHKPGNASAVDVRKNPTLDKFIYNSPEFKRGTPWSICVSLFMWNGYTFCDESSKSAQSAHWHIQPL